MIGESYVVGFRYFLSHFTLHFLLPCPRSSVCTMDDSDCVTSKERVHSLSPSFVRPSLFTVISSEPSLDPSRVACCYFRSTPQLLALCLFVIFRLASSYHIVAHDLVLTLIHNTKGCSFYRDIANNNVQYREETKGNIKASNLLR